MRWRLLICVGCAVLIPLPLLGQTFSGWRGDGSGRHPTVNVPLEWSAEKNIAWKTELPGGSPALPIVVGDRIFVMSDPALLLCIDVRDGKILWQRSHTGKDIGPEGARQVQGDGGRFNPDGNAGSAASTPVSDGKIVYAVFANGVVSAHTLDGTRRWMKFVEKPKTGFGHASSPALIGGLLFVHLIDFVALDAATGVEKWRKKIRATHATPLATRIGDVDVIVHPCGSILRATDGKVLAEKLFKLNQSSPVIHENVIYAHENGRLLALRLPKRMGDTLTVEKLWEVSAPRAQYQIPSPVVHEGYVYGVSMNGILHARELKTGQEVYRERLGLPGRVYVSVTLAGNHLFLANQQGKTVIVRPGRKFVIERTNNLDIHPSGFAFAKNRLLIRTWRHLYCVGE